VPNYVQALAAQSPHILPLVENHFFGIPGDRPEDLIELVQGSLAQTAAAGRVPHMSFSFTGEKAEPTDVAIATSALYDGYIAQIAQTLAGYGKPLFVRLGFEFNGSWNGYTAGKYVDAYRKVADAIRAKTSNAAFIWCYHSGGADDFDQELSPGVPKWFPGDAYADWYGLDVFYALEFDPAKPDSKNGIMTPKAKSEKFLQMAKDHKKPVFLSETSAAGAYILPSSQDPGFIEGIADWNSWFATFFDWMAAHPHIKGFIYYNNDWTNSPWSSWGDARIEINDYILMKYAAKMSEPRFLNLGVPLYN